MLMALERCTGPACPRCGCQDCAILNEPSQAVGQQFINSSDPEKVRAWGNSPWWGAGKARCRHCLTEFTFRELPGEPEPDPEPERADDECPKCGAFFKQYTTKGRVQYRKCTNAACGHKGKNPKRD